MSQEASRQAAPCAHASRSTHSPSGTIRPDSSAAPRNSRGGMTSPSAPPADQRLGADDTRGGQLHDRLVLQGQLAVADGLLQVGHDLQPADHVGVHVRGVRSRPGRRRPPWPGTWPRPRCAAPGRPDHRGGPASRRPGRHGHARARGERDLLARHPERLGGDRADQPPGDLGDLRRAGGVLDQDGELVTAPARDRVVRRDGGPQPPGGLGQHQVAGAVPDRIVDRGEAVQVEEDDADPAADVPSRSRSRARSSK